MNRPEFRTGGPQGGKGGSSKGATGAGGAAPGGGVSPFTRSQILHLMKTEFTRARRHGYAAACVMLQIDRLVQLIDMHGSQLRDKLKEHFINLVAEHTRSHDQLGALNEDRYLLILPHTKGPEARLVAGRILQAFQDLEVMVGGQTLALSLSVGVSATEDRETMFFDTMLSQAEVALEAAVAAGGGQVMVFERDQAIRQDPESEPFKS